MAYDVRLHPKVAKFLDNLTEGESKKCIEALTLLKENPYSHRQGADIKKLKGRLNAFYRLRAGDFRFEYWTQHSVAWVVKAFRREQGY